MRLRCCLPIVLLLGVAGPLLADGPAGRPRPLRVYVLAGQSNMEGHARIETIDYLGDDSATVPLRDLLVDEDGAPRKAERTWIANCTGPPGVEHEGHGRLTAGYGARRDPAERGDKIGPEFSFGLTLERHLDGPILLIKTAWGGKSLCYDFRPPGAGPYPRTEADVERDRNPVDGAGTYYRLMIDYVRRVLREPGRVCPDYDPGGGVELAGFVWFQGWNDVVNRDAYPVLPPGSTANRFAEYDRLLRCLIRDVRRDLATPDLPVVIGVMGVDGHGPSADHRMFRAAMAAPAGDPALGGPVIAVPTAPYWDDRLAAVAEKRGQVRQMEYHLRTRHPAHANRDGTMTAEQKRDYLATFESDLISAEEDALWRRGASNAGYHYLGSAKTMAQIGEAFARALIDRTPETSS